jgi:hypothetical protein
MSNCARCDRTMIVEDPNVQQNRYALESSWDGICQGCCDVFDRKAVEAYCEFHENTCVTANHYVDSLSLTSPDQCIEEQDITTLMINASYARYKAGEENPFFDRMISISDQLKAGTLETVCISDMTDEEQHKALFGDDPEPDTSDDGA